MNTQKKVLIIGSGPAGFAAAIRAAQLGAEVILVEKSQLGGTCLNHGCMPTKQLLTNVRMQYEQMKLNPHHYSLDYPQLCRQQVSLLQQLRQGMAALLEQYGITILFGSAKLLSPTTAELYPEESNAPFIASFDEVFAAIGSEPIKLTDEPLANLLTPDQLLSLPDVPNSLIIIGGSTTGLEMALIYRSLGSQVTIIEAKEHIAPLFDDDMAAEISNSLLDIGIKIHTNTTFTSLATDNNNIICTAKTANGTTFSLESSYVLNAAGRSSDFSDFIDFAGFKPQNEDMMLNHNYLSNQPHLYCIGDCSGKTLEAHAATEQGRQAVEYALQNRTATKKIYSHSIFTLPEAAIVGLSETACRKQNISYTCGIFPMFCSGRAKLSPMSNGMIKLIIEKGSNRLLGAQLICENAAELIALPTMLIQNNRPVTDLMNTVFPHPTIGEALREAALTLTSKSTYNLPANFPAAISL